MSSRAGSTTAGRSSTTGSAPAHCVDADGGHLASLVTKKCDQESRKPRLSRAFVEAGYGNRRRVALRSANPRSHRDDDLELRVDLVEDLELHVLGPGVVHPESLAGSALEPVRVLVRPLAHAQAVVARMRPALPRADVQSVVLAIAEDRRVERVRVADRDLPAIAHPRLALVGLLVANRDLQRLLGD